MAKHRRTKERPWLFGAAAPILARFAAQDVEF